MPRVFTITASYSYGTKQVSERTIADLNPYGSTQILPDALVDELQRMRDKVEVVGEQLRELISRIPAPER